MIFIPGQSVYWVHEDRTSGTDHYAHVRTGRFVNELCGVVVIECDGTDGKELAYHPVSLPVFADPAKADAYALGVCLRGMSLFNFARGHVTTTKGTITLHKPEVFRA